MTNPGWTKLTEIGGRLVAEELKSYLEANGIPVLLFQEGAGVDAFPVAIGSTLALVQIFVPEEHLPQAEELLRTLEAGSEEPIQQPIPDPGQE
ncbi:MAG: DUF2007 domain-containing protein [Anaerolineales bacterium]